MVKGNGVSERRGCALMGRHRSTMRYRPVGRDDAELREKLKAIADKHKRYGYRRACATLRRQGLKVNHKRVHRVWKEAGLQRPVRRRRPRGKPKGQVPLEALYPNHVWTYDFMEDATAEGRKLRLLTIVDEFSRTNIAIEVGRRMPSAKVIEVLEGVFDQCGTPDYLRSDNGSEFTAKAIKQWLGKCGIETYYIDPASPWQNAYGESFNGKLRDECLNMELFATVREARYIIGRWRDYYNTERPHSSLGYLTPNEFAEQWHRQNSNTASLTLCGLMGRDAKKAAEPKPCRLPIQSPASALGSLSSVALPSAQAKQTIASREDLRYNENTNSKPKPRS